MSRLIFEFDRPERFLIGTVGVPGEREFFLQVKGLSTGRKLLASFALEKAQAAALAERTREMIKEVARDFARQSSNNVADLAPLETPIEPEFSLGVMSLSWLPQEEIFLFEAQSIGRSDEVFEELISDDAPDAPPILRVKILGEDLSTFAKRTELVVAAGRQPCVFCGGPVNPGGHLCPRANGYRRQV
jgi:uncharacterized repeat protein (TIGR03847 family)